MKNSKLAIIIPAFKADYFSIALDSLAAQTNKNFSVYIGDDYSPDNLKAICDRYAASLDIIYHRFESNMGAKQIVHQWARCIALSKSEEWLWLFSDDDITDKTCVEKFYELLAKQPDHFDVCRFNTQMIDSLGKPLGVSRQGPSFESSAEMAYHLLLGKRGNSMPDHIFSRSIYDATGGFVFTQYAQSADWATSIKFSKPRGMYIIPDALVYWRVSGQNISSKAQKNKSEVVKGYFEFLRWLLKHFTYLKNSKTEVISYKQIKDASLLNLINVFSSHHKGANLFMINESIKLVLLEYHLNPIDFSIFVTRLLRKSFRGLVRRGKGKV